MSSNKGIKIPDQLAMDLAELHHEIFLAVMEICGGTKFPSYFKLPSDVRDDLKTLSVVDTQSREVYLTNRNLGATATTETRNKNAIHFAVATFCALRNFGKRDNPGHIIAPYTPSHEACEFKAWLDYEIARQDFGHESKWAEFEELPRAIIDELIIKAKQELVAHHEYLARKFNG